MPDWFYRPAAQPVLFCLPDRWSRAIALGIVGELGKHAAGRAVIEFMGHMAPAPDLAVRVAGVEFSSPVGLGWRVDPEQRATRGLMGFGIGCIEIREGPLHEVRRTAGEELRDEGSPRVGADPNTLPDSVPLLVRRIAADGTEVVQISNGAILPVVAWDETETVGTPPARFANGVVLQVGQRNSAGGWTVPTVMPAKLPAIVRSWRQLLPPEAALVVSGGVGQPSAVLTLIDAGASLVLIDAGLVFLGPGLVKRCNEALGARRRPPETTAHKSGIFRRAWFWSSVLGVAMAFGGSLTLLLALTRVLLPYDEHYLGLSGEILRRNSPQLFAFMSHDRGTLAGTMLGLGWLYLNLAWHGIRRGRHGAKTAVIVSALAGFVSFFAFFGFGYFDTLHAFVAAVLLQFTVQIMVGEDGGSSADAGVIDDEDPAWRRAQWGQLLWVVHAVGLLIAGAVILGIGVTSVFVSEDLEFLCMTAAQVKDLGTRMIGVVAHDRATLGGMLLASGVAMLLPVLWCFRRGERWIWRAILGLGVPAYGAAIGVHLKVGYTDWRHMVPAVVGFGLWLGGLVLSRTYLRETGEGPVSSRSV